MVFDRAAFERDRRAKAAAQASDPALQDLALRFVIESDRHNYAYQWTWLGLPIIQLPSDILMMQEIIWTTKPDLIIETGVAWGGSIVLYASLMELRGNGNVIGIDLNLAENVSEQVMAFPFAHRIQLIRGDSTSDEVLAEVSTKIGISTKVMVVLDSNHTHDHVLKELQAYGPLVTPGQYIVVSDTIVESLPPQAHRPRAWGPGNNPKTALDDFLAANPDFEVDDEISSRLLDTLTPGGYVRRLS